MTYRRRARSRRRSRRRRRLNVLASEHKSWRM